MATAETFDAVKDDKEGCKASILRHARDFTWQDLPLLRYKEQGTTFKDITRQVLFDGCSSVPTALRYFEIAPGGHSTLERHDHIHVVMVLRGEGEVFLGSEVHRLATHDIVHIPGGTWHQFRATAGISFGFLCLVATQRDRPQLPTPEDIECLRQNPLVAAFIRT